MFDYSALAVDVDNLKLKDEIDFSEAISLFTHFALQKKAKTQKIFPETIEAQKRAITQRMLKAFDEEELSYKGHPFSEPRVELEGQWGYNIEKIRVSFSDVISWAIKVSIPVPAEFQYVDAEIQQEAAEPPAPQGEAIASETAEPPAPQEEVVVNETSEPSAPTEEAVVYEAIDCSTIDVQALNVATIEDGALKSMGDDQYPAAKFYGALFAGLLMGRQSGTVRKNDLERALKKMGFVGDLKIKDKDFQSLWKAIPKGLKLQGKPPVEPIG